MKLSLIALLVVGAAAECPVGLSSKVDFMTKAALNGDLLKCVAKGTFGLLRVKDFCGGPCDTGMREVAAEIGVNNIEDLLECAGGGGILDPEPDFSMLRPILDFVNGVCATSKLDKFCIASTVSLAVEAGVSPSISLELDPSVCETGISGKVCETQTSDALFPCLAKEITCPNTASHDKAKEIVNGLYDGCTTGEGLSAPDCKEAFKAFIKRVKVLFDFTSTENLELRARQAMCFYTAFGEKKDEILDELQDKAISFIQGLVMSGGAPDMSVSGGKLQGSIYLMIKLGNPSTAESTAINEVGLTEAEVAELKTPEADAEEIAAMEEAEASTTDENPNSGAMWGPTAALFGLTALLL